MKSYTTYAPVCTRPRPPEIDNYVKVATDKNRKASEQQANMSVESLSPESTPPSHRHRNASPWVKNRVYGHSLTSPAEMWRPETGSLCSTHGLYTTSTTG